MSLEIFKKNRKKLSVKPAEIVTCVMVPLPEGAECTYVEGVDNVRMRSTQLHSCSYWPYHRHKPTSPMPDLVRL